MKHFHEMVDCLFDVFFLFEKKKKSKTGGVNSPNVMASNGRVWFHKLFIGSICLWPLPVRMCVRVASSTIFMRFFVCLFC